MGAVHTAAGRGRHSRHRGHRQVGVVGIEVVVGFRMVCVLMSHAMDFKKERANRMVQRHGSEI